MLTVFARRMSCSQTGGMRTGVSRQRYSLLTHLARRRNTLRLLVLLCAVCTMRKDTRALPAEL